MKNGYSNLSSNLYNAQELHKLSVPWFVNQKKIYTLVLPLCTGQAFLKVFLNLAGPFLHSPDVPDRHYRNCHYAFASTVLKAMESSASLFSNLYFNIITAIKDSSYKERLNTIHPDSPNVSILPIFLYHPLSVYIHICKIYKYIF